MNFSVPASSTQASVNDAKATVLPRTTVVHVKDGCDEYIGRAMPGYARSDFANDFRVGPDGTLDEVVDKYKVRLVERLAVSAELRAKLAALKGKSLGCWCKKKGRPAHLQKRCHGDVLVELLEGPDDTVPVEPVQRDLF